MTAPVTVFDHDLVLHDGPDELLDLMVPFVQDGAAAGDRVVVVGELDMVEALLAAVPDAPRVHGFAEPGAGRYPGRELHRFGQLLRSFDDVGSRVRIVNQMPAMTADRWPEWRRYEAAANVVLAPYRSWGTCAYDSGRLAPGMLADLMASHTHVQSAAGRRRSERYADLDRHVHGYLDRAPHPAEGREPSLALADPSAASARRAVRGLASEFGLTGDATEAAVLAASETVTNGLLHGRAPVLLRAWADAGRVTVAVSDAGAGPHPLVGLVPAALDGPSGRGMWMLHQLLADVHHRTGRDGYTVTFSVDSAGPSPFTSTPQPA